MDWKSTKANYSSQKEGVRLYFHDRILSWLIEINEGELQDKWVPEIEQFFIPSEAKRTRKTHAKVARIKQTIMVVNGWTLCSRPAEFGGTKIHCGD